MTRDPHILLKIHVSAVAYMHYAATSAGRDYAVSPGFANGYTAKTKLIGRFDTAKIICRMFVFETHLKEQVEREAAKSTL